MYLENGVQVIIPVILPLIDQGWGLAKVAMTMKMRIMIMEVLIKIININMSDNWKRQ